MSECPAEPPTPEQASGRTRVRQMVAPRRGAGPIRSHFPAAPYRNGALLHGSLGCRPTLHEVLALMSPTTRHARIFPNRPSPKQNSPVGFLGGRWDAGVLRPVGSLGRSRVAWRLTAGPSTDPGGTPRSASMLHVATSLIAGQQTRQSRRARRQSTSQRPKSSKKLRASSSGTLDRRLQTPDRLGLYPRARLRNEDRPTNRPLPASFVGLTETFQCFALSASN